MHFLFVKNANLHELHFLGSGPGTWVPLGPNHPPKNYLRGVKWALKISPRSVRRVKSCSTFLQWRTDAQTHGHRRANCFTTTRDFFWHMCEGWRGKVQTLQNFYLFTSWRITRTFNYRWSRTLGFPSERKNIGIIKKNSGKIVILRLSGIFYSWNFSFSGSAVLFRLTSTNLIHWIEA